LPDFTLEVKISGLLAFFLVIISVPIVCLI
jgi:hypothetical protein